MKQHYSIEDDQSLALYKERKLKRLGLDDSGTTLTSFLHNDNFHRRLSKDAKDVLKAQHGKKTQHGIMIDAGSQGTRVHIYEFNARKLKKRKEVENVIHGLRLSFPTTETRWTDRLKPGLDSFAFIADKDLMYAEVKSYLEPLFEFAKDVLEDKEKQWDEYPIYLKATGGLRSLPRPYRIRLINCVRKIMDDKDFNPFFFEEEHTRVISGEEEAIYGWAAVNFVKGKLIKESEGIGRVVDTSKTYGVLEMGGASAQIGFLEPNGDVMANLFKLQIGAAKHWNVYVHSFLYFGVNLAYEQLNAELFTDSQDTPSNDTQGVGVYNPCLPGNSQYLFSSRVHAFPNHTFLPLSSPNDLALIVADSYSSIMRNDYQRGDYNKCNERVQKILRKDANAWCNFAHDRDCSLAGIYQPQLPVFGDDSKHFGEFIATSNFYDVFDFLGLAGEDVALKEIRHQTKVICNMSLGELVVYNNLRDKPLEIEDVKQMCFRAAFISAYLIEGFGFPETYKITSADVIDGQKLNWALGSMIYEINTLPWEFKKHSRWLPDILADIAPSHLLEHMNLKKETEHIIDNLFVLILIATICCIGYSISTELKRRRRYATNSNNSYSTHQLNESNALLSTSEGVNTPSSYQSNSS